MNPYENEFDDLNEENNEIDEFMKQFMKNIPTGNIFQIKLPINAVPMVRVNELCSIFNGKFLINFINKIDLNGSNKILLECVQVDSYKEDTKATLLDAYNYLNSTHFLNFILAKEFGIEVWAYEGIDIQMQIVESESGKSSGKILIIIESSHCPENIVTILNSDYDAKKYVNYNNTIPECPMIERVLMRKSYYSPLLVYDITFGLDSNSNANFDILHYGNFYDFVIKKYIDEAIEQFYPISIQTKELRELGERVIRTSFSVDYEGKLFSIRMICMPAYVINNEELVKKYIYVGENLHLLKVSDSAFPNDDFSSLTKFRNFIAQASSSDTSQILIPLGESDDIITEYYEDYHVCKLDEYLFSPNYFINNYTDVCKDDNNNPMKCSKLEIVHSNFDIIHNYWVMDNPVIINGSSSGSLQLKVYGFINFNKSGVSTPEFAECYDKAKPEIMQIFNVSENDYNNNLKSWITYDGKSIVRIILCSEINNKPRPTPEKKKKFKLFGR